MKEWSDQRNWWMDLLKTIIGLVLGTIVAVFIVSHIDEKRQRTTIAWQIDQVRRVSAMQDFTMAVIQYRNGAYDAARERLRDVPLNKSEVIRKWQSEVYPKLLSARLSVKQSFLPLEPKLVVFDGELQKVFSAVNAAPLFPIGKTPNRCDSKQEVDIAWRRLNPPRIRSMAETRQMWEVFKGECFDRVIEQYNSTADDIVTRMMKDLQVGDPR